MDAVPLNAQDVLRTFFADAPELRHPSMRTRAARLQDDFEALLEREGPPLMDEDERTIYQAELQIEPGGAAVRTMSATTLLRGLGALVSARLMPTALPEASAWLRAVDALNQWTRRRAGAMVHSSTLATVDHALAVARSRVEAQRRPSEHR